MTQRIFTPLDFKTELNAHLGSAFSLEPILTQSAYFRVKNRDPRIEGLYFAGAGTHPGAGIPGVVNSAKATSGLVIADREKLRSTVVSVPQSFPAAEGTEAALVQCREMIRVGSRSFSFAATLFPPETRDAAFFLYGWCRYCDDQVDAVLDTNLQAFRVKALREETEAAFRGEASANPVFIALQYLVQKYQIPSYYALELLEGMAMDARRDRYWTPEDLSLYCYRVAGTVGLMMVPVMGVSDSSALRNASSLGIAMQLTNIARDVMEDAAMGRVYLPLTWLEEAGIPEGRIAERKFRPLVAQVVARLLHLADGYYREGNLGLRFLPWRAALAVGVASSVYSRIGLLVSKRGARAWESRCVVSRPGKILAALRGIGLVVQTIPYRLWHPWRRVVATGIWRHA